MITFKYNNLEITEGTFQSDSRTMLSSPSVTPEMDDNMKTITEQTCKDIMRKKKSLDDFSKAEQKQIFNLMFGEEFMESNDKGSLQQYEGGK